MSLTLSQLRNLHTIIQTYYKRWVSEAPQSYKQDKFILDRVPIVITSRYGQNQDLGITADDMERDAASWARDRDFTQVRYISIAIATHIK